MKDNLKERIERSRKEWDHYETDLEGLWGDIESQLDEKDNKNAGFNTNLWLKIAASVTLIALVGWGITASLKLRGDSELYALHDISPELAETEYFYASQINEKLQMIQTSDSDMNNLVMEDLILLDSAYYELQRDLKDNADSEEVINAMIQNYRIKLQVLEKVLEQIRTEEQKEESNEIII